MNRAIEISIHTKLTIKETFAIYELTGNWDAVFEWGRLRNLGMEYTDIENACFNGICVTNIRTN